MQQILEAATIPSDAATILTLPCEDRTGESIYEIRILREFDRNYSLTTKKVRDLWVAANSHKGLFSDLTEGKFEPFFILLMDPQGVWFEICKQGEDVPVGVAYITRVRPFHEADAHIAFWDSIASGREPLALFLTEWVMDRYNLHRINAYIPTYQRGTNKFVLRMGFKLEGVKREGVLHAGEYESISMYGLLRSELQEQLQKVW